MPPVQVPSNQHHDQEEAVPLARQANQRTGNSECTGLFLVVYIVAAAIQTLLFIYANPCMSLICQDGTSWRQVWRCHSYNTLEVPKDSVCPDGSIAYKTYTCAFEMTLQSVNTVCETRYYLGHIFFACLCYPTISYIAKKCGTSEETS